MTTTGAGTGVPASRRPAIADAAITIIARDGLRSLTHRAVDRELELPAGSTSYYARTRRQLIQAVVHRLADRTRNDLQTAAPSASAPVPSSVAELATDLAALLDQLAVRGDDHLVRFALAVDLTDDRELHDLVTSGSPVRQQMLARAEATLGGLGVADPAGSAPGLIALVDGLLWDRLAGSGRDPRHRPDAARVLAAYLTGLPRASTAAAPGPPEPGA